MSTLKNHDMKFKGTPGPWHISFHGSDNCWVVDSERNKAIARVTKYNNDGPAQKANFQLLAAAPELLEALQAVVRIADRKTDEFDMARAAINKALGL